MMEELILHRPALEELEFRQRLLGDPATMAYNHAYGGTITFPRERWEDWYARWVADTGGTRFYRYLYDRASGTFVGEAAYHYDEDFREFLCDIIVSAAYRGRGYGREGLRLLCNAAKENGVKRLCDHIAADNPSVALFQSAGFVEEGRNDEFILVSKTL